MAPLYTLLQDADPMDYDLLVVSINSVGAPGNLNRSVMKRAGYPEGLLPGETELRSGYHLIRRDLLKPVLFIVVNPEGEVREQLQYNLYNGLLTYREDLVGKRVWLPLLGTGAGRLAYAESLVLTTQVIESLMDETRAEPAEFIISVPGTEEGLALLRELGVETSRPAAENAADTSGRRYWIFKMAGDWTGDGLEEGKSLFFQPKDFKGQPLRTAAEAGVRPGDRALAFFAGLRKDAETHEGYPGSYIWGELEAETQIETTVSLGARMKVVHKFHRPTSINLFKELFPDSERNLGRASPVEDFISISEESYHAILALEERPFVNTLRPFYLTEGNHRQTEDQLGFEADIDAFANIIRQADVKPPLAIGLFGHWGSGKSFFMEKLEERIADKTRWPLPEYVQHVVPVRFNSWHYSDANLWASMIVHIFKSLNEYAAAKLKDAKPQNAVKSIYERLSITKSEIAVIDAKITAKSAEVDALEAQKTVVEETLREQRATLSSWKVGEVMQAVFSNERIRREMAALNAELGTEPLTDNIETMRARLDAMATQSAEQKDAWTALLRNRRGKWILVGIVAGLVAVMGFMVRSFVLENFREVIAELTAASAVLLSGLGVLWKWFDRGSKQVRGLYNRLNSLVKTVEQAKSKKEVEGETERKALESSISRLDAEKAALEQQKAEALAAQAALETELEDISSGKRLADFLARKTSDDNYARQLGIISWIREDLKSLNDHFEDQRKARAAGHPPSDSQLQIDRIVLYIDDLDRCNEDVVVKVLEAIHLLLAFPLFVVVVGVDPRWLNNAITEKYQTLFKPAAGGEAKEDERGDGDSEPMRGVATSYDYLEKIFQIPFALQRMTKTGQNQLLKYLAQDATNAAEAVKEETKKTGETATKQTDNGDTETDISVHPSTKELFSSSQQEKPDTTQTANEEEQQNSIATTPPRNPQGKLTISPDELAYMQELSELFAHTPRTANRYVNIYRLIKAHGNLHVVGKYEVDEFAPILFLLAVIVGQPECADAFITRIRKAKDTDKCGDFLDGCGIEPLREKALKVIGRLSTMQVRYLKKNLPLVARFSFRTLMRDLS